MDDHNLEEWFYFSYSTNKGSKTTQLAAFHEEAIMAISKADSLSPGYKIWQWQYSYLTKPIWKESTESLWIENLLSLDTKDRSEL